MKSITEFWGFNLLKAAQTKEALLAQGKTPEEILQSLGESFKLEGDKLKHFSNAVDVAKANSEKLHRVLVVSLNEGESAPAKSAVIEEFCYVPAFVKEVGTIVKEKIDHKAAARNKGKSGGDRTKTSPWGLTPEEKAKKGEKKA